MEMSSSLRSTSGSTSTSMQERTWVWSQQGSTLLLRGDRTENKSLAARQGAAHRCAEISVTRHHDLNHYIVLPLSSPPMALLDTLRKGELNNLYIVFTNSCYLPSRTETASRTSLLRLCPGLKLGPLYIDLQMSEQVQ